MIINAGSGGGGGGSATAANQVTGNNSLASIDSKTPALGQALAAGSVPVVLTAIQIAALTPNTQTDGVTRSNLASLYVGGTARNVASLPSYTAGQAAGLAMNMADGSLLVTNRNLIFASDKVDVSGSAVTVTLPSGAQTLTSSNATDSTGSPVTAGATSIVFTTSSSFTGSINGITRIANTSYAIDAAQGKTLPSIAYTVTAGSMTIDKLV